MSPTHTLPPSRLVPLRIERLEAAGTSHIRALDVAITTHEASLGIERGAIEILPICELEYARARFLLECRGLWIEVPTYLNARRVLQNR